MTITVRPATDFDGGAMAALLTAIIEQGGSTALTGKVTGEDIRKWMSAAPGRSAWGSSRC